MKSEILYPGAFPMARVELTAGESIKAESGAMVASSPTIDVESKMEGGFLGALSRKLLTGEKFFFQTLRASRGPGEVLLAPTVPGEIVVLELDGVNEYMVQKDGFLAGGDTINIESKMQSLTRGLMGGEGFFILKIGGKGTLILNSFGAILEFPHRILQICGHLLFFDGRWRSSNGFLHFLIQLSNAGFHRIDTALSDVVALFKHGIHRPSALGRIGSGRL